MAGTFLEIYSQRVNRMLQWVSMDACEKAAEVTIQRARDNLVKGDHNDTYNLSQSIHATVIRTDSGGTSVRVGSDLHYAKWAEGGRGPIVARPGKVLAFRPRGSSTVVFAKRVGPAKAIRFLENALKSLRASDFAKGRT